MANSKKKTYPISRALTHPATGVGLGALAGLISLKTRKASGMRPLSKKLKRLTVAGSAAAGGGSTYIRREFQAQSLRDSLKKKSKNYSKTEKKLLLRGVKTKKWSKQQKTISQHATSPLSMGVISAILGGAMAGPAGAVMGGAQSAADTAISRFVGARALAGRANKGEGLYKREKALLREVKRYKAKQKAKRNA